MTKEKYIRKTYKDTDIAYFAGIVDGEGSLTIGTYAKTKKGTPVWHTYLGISNTEESLIHWICERFGGAKLKYTPKQTPKNSRKEVFRWQCSGERLLHICELILPYSVCKKRQIEIMIEVRNSFKLIEYNDGNRGPSISQDVLDLRLNLMLELRNLHNRLSSIKHK